MAGSAPTLAPSAWSRKTCSEVASGRLPQIAADCRFSREVSPAVGSTGPRPRLAVAHRALAAGWRRGPHFLGKSYNERSAGGDSQFGNFSQKVGRPGGEGDPWPGGVAKAPPVFPFAFPAQRFESRLRWAGTALVLVRQVLRRRFVCEPL